MTTEQSQTGARYILTEPIIIDKPGHKISLPLLRNFLILRDKNAFQFNLHVRMCKTIIMGEYI